MANFKSTDVLPYVQGVSVESLFAAATVFKFGTTLQSQLVQPKENVILVAQDGVVCQCGKTYIGVVYIARTQTSALSEHAHETGH